MVLFSADAVNRESFFARIEPEPNTGCFLWTGKEDRHGYGIVYLPSGGEAKAHRVAYALHYGPFDASLGVLHTCDTPPCVGHDHLFLGTQTDNNADKMRKGRYRNRNTGKTQCIRGHELTPENTYFSKRRGKSRIGRQCRTCNLDRRRNALPGVVS